jgi:hypothetical protein
MKMSWLGGLKRKNKQRLKTVKASLLQSGIAFGRLIFGTAEAVPFRYIAFLAQMKLKPVPS